MKGIFTTAADLVMNQGEVLGFIQNNNNIYYFNTRFSLVNKIKSNSK